MIFVSPLFFEFEPIKIANVSENGGVFMELSRFISSYEKKCLVEILGVQLYEELAASFEFSEGAFSLKTDATLAIKNLVNGLQYDAPQNQYNDFEFGLTSCSQNASLLKRNWKGLVESDSYVFGNEKTVIKKSFIADYIYYHYCLTNRSITSGTGQQVLSGENSTTVSNFSKRIDRYNEFVFSVIGGPGRSTSLYRFLKDHKEEYPTWVINRQIRFKDKY